MTDSLKELYQDVILDHSKAPRNFGKPESYSHEAHGYNPLCGDTINIYLTLSNEGQVEDLSFDGKGCAISVASASLMTEILKNKTENEAKSLFNQFHGPLDRADHASGIPWICTAFCGIACKLLDQHRQRRS